VLITADQLVAHLVGDYVLQSDWMASKKRTNHVAAFVHAIVYSIPFAFFAPSATALWLIVYSHYLIDYYGLARYVVWAKNCLAPRGWMKDASGWVIEGRTAPWSQCRSTGYPPDRPVWLATWLLIIADNVLHILINGLALKWL
jgi:uncharacterized protein DUF3307